jgi:hypothetical protein
MSFASLGMKSAAFSGHVEDNEGFIHHRVIIRQYNLIVELRMVSAGGVALDEFIQYAELLDVRLKAINLGE